TAVASAAATLRPATAAAVAAAPTGTTATALRAAAATAVAATRAATTVTTGTRPDRRLRSRRLTGRGPARHLVLIEVFVGLRDVDQGFRAGQNLDEGAAGQRARDRAFPDLADLYFLGKAADLLDGAAHPLGVRAADADGAVVRDIDGRAGLLDHGADDTAAW